VILLIQLLAFSVVITFRWWALTGRHLSPVKDATLSPMLEWTSRGKSGVLARQVGLELAGAYPLLVVRERWYHQFLKWIGLGGEVEIGDAALDTKWYLVAGRPDHLRWALHSPTVRAKLERLLASPIKAVRSSRGRAWIELGEQDFGKEPSALKGYVDLLAELQRALSAVRAVNESPSATRRREPWLWVAAHTALLVAGVGGLAVPFLDREVLLADSSGLWLRVALLGPLVAAAWFLALRLRFAGTGWLTWLTADFFFVGLAGILLCTFHVARAANLGLDEAPARLVSCTVLSRGCWLECWKGSGKSRRAHAHPLVIEACSRERRQETVRDWYTRDDLCLVGARFRLAVLFRAWRDGEPPVQVWMPEDAWDHATAGSSVVVPVHPGALGVEWYEPRRVDPATPTRE
jgi:hypothetical protein